MKCCVCGGSGHDCNEIFELISDITREQEPMRTEDEAAILEAVEQPLNPNQKSIATTGMDLIATLIRKNSDYGSSVFHRPALAAECDPSVAIRVRMSDKIERLKHLLGGAEQQVKSESISDTVADLAGYCILYLTLAELQEKECSSGAAIIVESPQFDDKVNADKVNAIHEENLPKVEIVTRPSWTVGKEYISRCGLMAMYRGDDGIDSHSHEFLVVATNESYEFDQQGYFFDSSDPDEFDVMVDDHGPLPWMQET